MTQHRRELQKKWRAHKNWDHDDLLADGDALEGARRRFEKYASVGGPQNWWNMNWTENAVYHFAYMINTDVGTTKKVIREMRKNTEKWWRAAWREWQAAGLGVRGMNETERRGRLAAGWDVARRLLGDDHRDDAGRRMASATAITKWSWVQIGQQLRKWTGGASNRRLLVLALLQLPDKTRDSMAQTLRDAGVRLHDNGEDSEDETDDEEEKEEDELHYLRRWEHGGGQKRTAREVANDEHETAANRLMARRWMDENIKRQKIKNTKSTSTTRTRKHTRPTRPTRPNPNPTPPARARRTYRQQRGQQQYHQAQGGGGGGGGPA